jgi:hypothetical protein
MESQPETADVPFAPKPFQFSLRSVLVVTTGYAVLWGLAVSVGDRAVVLLALLSILVVLGLIHVVAFYLVGRLPRPRRWRAIGTCLILVGGAIGLWSGACFEYQVSERHRFVGFPIPMAVFQLEDGRWVDYIGNPLVVLLDGFLVATALLAPFTVLLVVKSLLGRRDVPGVSAGNLDSSL